jgi:oligopeptide/dipeptide ABC transporter ATP-binding protein
MALLDVTNLTIEYQTGAGKFRAVEGLEFSLEPGRSLGLVGESGCGKTSAMLSLMRLLPEAGRIVDGEVILDGIDLMRLTPRQMQSYRGREISMVFQGAMNAMNPTRTIGSQICEAITRNPWIPRNRIKEEVARLLNLVGIMPKRASEYPHQYSGGMRQRAMVAMALACQPKILIADEPTTALDVMIQAQILDLLQSLQKELGIAIIIVTHDLGMVAELCDDVIVMYGGRMAEYGSADVIFNNARHPYTQRLLKAFPDIANPGVSLASIPGYPPPLNNLPPGCRFEPRCDQAGVDCRQASGHAFQITPGHLVGCLRVERGDF